MDEGAIERARNRVEQRAEAIALDTLLDQLRAKLERLTTTAEEAAVRVPERIDEAVQAGMRAQVAPVGRNLAEIRGLMNQLLRRLESVEGDTAADRQARVDDLALLVDLISSGWQSVDARLGRVEAIVARMEKSLQQPGGAIVYRIEERRPDAANGP